jgi:hypothetical protein
LPHSRSQQIENGITVVPAEGTFSPADSAIGSGSFASSLSSIEDEAHLGVAPVVDPPREFFLNVVLERTEATFNTRGPGKPKTVSESKPGPKLPVLELSRITLVENILEVHGLQERFFPGPISGPPFRVTFKGLTGGARGAPTIRQDDDWTSLKGQLSKTKAAVDTLQVVISLKDLEPYKNHNPSPLTLLRSLFMEHMSPLFMATAIHSVNWEPRSMRSRQHGHVSSMVIATSMLKAPISQ